MVEIIRDKMGLEGIIDHWNQLARPFNNPLMNYEWFAACADALYENDDLHVVTVGSNNNISAIAPLVVTKKRGVKWLEFMGSSFLYEPSGLLYDNEDSLTELVNGMLKLKYPIYLNRFPAESPIGGTVRRLAGTRWVLIERNSPAASRLPVRSGWERFYETISSRRRYDLRRARKRAAEFGEVSFSLFCPAPEDLHEYLEKAFEVEASNWKARNKSAILFNPALRKFFTDYAASACRDGSLRLCFMKINDEIASMQIAVEYGGSFWALKIGYNEKWARCSPGILLTNECIKYSYDNGLKSYEFLGADEPWLHIWARDKRSYSSTGMYPAAFSGMYSLGADLGDYALRKIMRKFKKSKKPASADLR